ncbi:hypothetical protein [Streptomyces sp. NPDC047108]|uniref:hypothetical protein n=1 Tax=Streptomyces sp. NPDC047108 TaxID=3155025 RepID=UPI0033E94E32
MESRRQPAVQCRATVPGSGTAASGTAGGGPGGAAAQTHGREIRAVLDDLDEQIVAMVLRRAELARRYQSVRRVSGLPATELAWENRTLSRFADRLGAKGADIARAVLSLSQLATAHGGPGPGGAGPGGAGPGGAGPGGAGPGGAGPGTVPGGSGPGRSGAGGSGPGRSAPGTVPGDSGHGDRRHGGGPGAGPRNGDGGKPAE